MSAYGIFWRGQQQLEPQGAHTGYSNEKMVRNGRKLNEIRLSRPQSRAPKARNRRAPPTRRFRTFPRETGHETVVSHRVFGRFGPFFLLEYPVWAPCARTACCFAQAKKNIIFFWAAQSNRRICFRRLSLQIHQIGYGAPFVKKIIYSNKTTNFPWFEYLLVKTTFSRDLSQITKTCAHWLFDRTKPT